MDQIDIFTMIITRTAVFSITKRRSNQWSLLDVFQKDFSDHLHLFDDLTSFLVEILRILFHLFHVPFQCIRSTVVTIGDPFPNRPKIDWIGNDHRIPSELNYNDQDRMLDEYVRLEWLPGDLNSSDTSICINVSTPCSKRSCSASTPCGGHSSASG